MNQSCNLDDRRAIHLSGHQHTMPLDQLSPPAEVVEGGAPGGESGEGGTRLSGITIDALREIIEAEVRSANSLVAPPPPLPQPQ